MSDNARENVSEAMPLGTPSTLENEVHYLRAQVADLIKTAARDAARIAALEGSQPPSEAA